MGLKIEVNTILRTDEVYDLKVGQTYSFSKSGSRVFMDNIPMWLTNRDWLAQAEIKIMSQTRKDNVVTGEFRVEYIYEGQEQEQITAMFIRMYAGLSDKNIYMISDQTELEDANKMGFLTRDSLSVEGFIHASPKSQLTRVANKYYKAKTNPLILVIQKDKLTTELKWEPATGGTYPHLYGNLNLDAIVKTIPIQLEENGRFDIEI